MNMLTVVLGLIVFCVIARFGYILTRESYDSTPQDPPRAPCDCNQGRLLCTCKPVCARCRSPDHHVSDCPHLFI